MKMKSYKIIIFILLLSILYFNTSWAEDKGGQEEKEEKEKQSSSAPPESELQEASKSTKSIPETSGPTISYLILSGPVIATPLDIEEETEE